MKRLLLLTLAALLAPMAALAQDSNWEYDGFFPPDEEDPIHITNYGVNGLVVDNQDRVWIPSYYNRIVVDGVTMSALRVFEEDGTEVDFSPITEITVGDVTDVLVYDGSLANSGSGLALDDEGHIIYNTRSTSYRINSETGEGMARFTWGSGAFTGPSSAEGLVLISSIVAGPVELFDTNYNSVIVVAEEAAGVRRATAISDDAMDVFVPIIGENGGYTLHYSGDELSGYEKQDSIAFGLHPASAGVRPGTTELWLSSGDNVGDNVVNTMVGEPTDTDYIPNTWYAYDYETGDIVDQITWEQDAAMTPRGIAFNQDGDVVYLGSFDSGNGIFGVLRYRRVTTSIENRDELPTAFELKQNYPNPFNPSTKIEFAVRDAGDVSLKVYDVLGRQVATLQDGPMAAGSYTATFDASQLASGTYIYVLESAGNRVSKSMVLLK